MISYNESSSSYFIDNRNICQKIESEFASYNTKYYGYCGSYGYKIEGNFELNNHLYQIHYEKSAHTQGGRLIVYTHGIESLCIKIKATNFHLSKLSIGKSKLRRLFMKPSLKSCIPSPYYLKSKSVLSKESIIKLFNLILYDNIWKVKFSKSNVSVIIYDKMILPHELVSKIETIINYA